MRGSMLGCRGCVSVPLQHRQRPGGSSPAGFQTCVLRLLSSTRESQCSYARSAGCCASKYRAGISGPPCSPPSPCAMPWEALCPSTYLNSRGPLFPPPSPPGGGGYAEIGRGLFCPVPHVREGLGSLFGRHNVAKTECPFFFKFTQSLGPGSLGLQFWHMTSTHLKQRGHGRGHGERDRERYT